MKYLDSTAVEIRHSKHMDSGRKDRVNYWISEAIITAIYYIRSANNPYIEGQHINTVYKKKPSVNYSGKRAQPCYITKL